MGTRDGLPDDINTMIDKTEEMSKDGTRATLVMCFNYGGQDEIVRAARELIAQGASAESITVESFAQALDHPDVPPCDLIVRTSGEERLSDFMLWRAAYSEFLFLDKLWPEMTEQDVAGILDEYASRHRRFGG
jgi:undecaprenyl diphosphate synthase